MMKLRGEVHVPKTGAEDAKISPKRICALSPFSVKEYASVLVVGCVSEDCCIVKKCWLEVPAFHPAFLSMHYLSSSQLKFCDQIAKNSEFWSIYAHTSQIL